MKSEITIILLADDDIDDQELLKEAFSKTEPRAEVFGVVFGRDVFSFLDARPDDQLPDLIILDYNMPDYNGAEVLQLLNKSERYRHIPAVIWSTSNAEFYREIARKSGAKEYFSKPYLFDDVVKLSAKMLSHI